MAMTTCYAQIDAARIVFAVSQLAVPVQALDMIPIESYDDTLIGKRHDAETGAFVDVASPALNLPEIVITAVQSDTTGMVASADWTDITVPVGSTLAFTAELRGADAQVLPLDDAFRMPIRSRDGRERVLLANMVQGVISFAVRLDDSRVWDVSAEVINADLPPEARMAFAGVKVFAVEM